MPHDPWYWAEVTADVKAVALGTPAHLEKLRQQRWRALLRSAAQHSPLYGRILQGRNLEQVGLQDLPVMHKDELMAHYDDWVCDPHVRLADLQRFTDDRTKIATPYIGRYVVWESSGSVGGSAVFIQDARAMAVYDALEFVRRPNLQPMRRLFDPLYWGERIAFVGSTEGHFASTVFIERLRRINPALAPSVHCLSFLQKKADLLAQLHAINPTILATYPSSAVLLAEEISVGHLRMAPQEIWTGGETLTPGTQRLLQERFGCPVANSYGASEFLTLASQCCCGHLHLNADWAIVESVDKAYQPVPPGEPGATVLLTNLANHVQPIIRYDLSDRITLSAQPCDCGSVLPRIEVEGRSDDTLRLGEAGSAQVSIAPLALTTVLEEATGQCDLQLVQQGPSTLLLRTARSGKVAQHDLRQARTALTAFLTQQGAEGIHIACHMGESPVPNRSGKLARVLRWH